jgi:hypothetical protein
VAEGARLESVYTFTGIGGSNPSLSAIILSQNVKRATPLLAGDSIAKAGMSGPSDSLIVFFPTSPDEL